MRAWALVREAYATATASRAYSVVFGLVAFVVVFVVIALNGQAQAQRASVLATFDREEFRTVTVTDQQDLGVIPWSMGERARGLSGVQQAWVLGPAFDVVNGALPDAGRASAQTYEGPWQGAFRLVDGRAPRGPWEAVADVGTAQRLGFDASGGWVLGPAGEQWALVGVYAPLHERSPRSVLVPRRPTSGNARSVSFTVSDLSAVDALSQAVPSLTDATGPGQLAVDKSADAGALRQAIAGTVSRYGVTIVTTVMATSGLSLAFLSVLMVHSRRQEFGRRRALGATRGTVVALVVLHGAMVVTVGASAGIVAGAAWTSFRYDVGNPLGFLLVLMLTVVSGTAVAQIPSALAAGLRDPVRVLRTP